MAESSVRVVFDCYNTLVDSPPEPEFEDQAAAFARACDVDLALAGRMFNWLNTRLFRAIHATDTPSPAMDDLLEQCLDRFGTALDPEMRETLLLDLFARGAAYVPAVSALEAVAVARGAGAELAILSNSELPSRLVLRLLADAGHDLSGFAAIHFSGDGGPRKPDPGAFDLVEAPGRRHVMVGDSATHDLDPARQRGWTAVESGRDMARDLASAIADARSGGEEVRS